MTSRKYVECDGVFKPFALAPDVCGTCGEDRDGHPDNRADMLPYKEAVWKFMLANGGTYSFYGSYGYDSAEIKKHIEVCGLNFDKMSTPEMEDVGEFAGTFTDAHVVPVVKGYIVCNCDEYEDSKWDFDKQDWIVRDMSLGQIIWQVVKAGEQS